MKYIVYCTTNIVNGKIYVGVHETISPDKFDYYLGNGIYANKPSTYNHPKHIFSMLFRNTVLLNLEDLL